MTPLEIAAVKGQFHIVKYLIQKQQFNILHLLECSSFSGNLSLVQYLIQTYEKEITKEEEKTAFILSCSKGQLPVVQYFVETRKININTKIGDNHTPIEIACEKGFLELFKYLYEKGAKKDDKELLFKSCEYQQLAIIKYLIEEQKISPELRNENGQTLLLSACEYSHYDIIKYLCEHGCDKTVVNQNGFNALHYSCLHPNIKIIKYLISQSIPKDSKTIQNLTPLDIALNNCSDEAIRKELIHLFE